MKKTIKIDNQKITFEGNLSLLEAARKYDKFIPTFCYDKDNDPDASCRICLVHDKNSDSLVPACATLALDGMEIETNSDVILESRKMTLELLLSEHRGNCISPCQNVCYLDLDIPLMINKIKSGDYNKALEIIHNDLLLLPLICKICSAPCQNACQRKKHEQTISIKALVNHVLENSADSNFHRKEEQKEKLPVAVIGTDPSGISFAHYLLKYGYQVHIYDHVKRIGDILHDDIWKIVPEEILTEELNLLKKMGGQFFLGEEMTRDRLSELEKNYSALVITTADKELSEYSVSGKTFQTQNKKIFKVKSALSLEKNIVQSMGRGKKCAYAVRQFLLGEKVNGKYFNSRMRGVGGPEINEYLKLTDLSEKIIHDSIGESLTKEQASIEVRRCFQCQCGKKDNCRLRQYSDIYEANQSAYKGEQPKFNIEVHSSYIFEMGKCIKCGICTQISERANLKYGHIFMGRSFDLRVGLPFGPENDLEFSVIVKECIEKCPTGALTNRRKQAGEDAV